MPAGRRVCGFCIHAARGCASVAEAGLGPRTVCVVGNEGAGVTRETMALCDALVTIPMSGRAESLNASAAAAILMWEMMRER